MIRAAVRGRPFPYRRNSLNLFRLVFAALVLVAHSYHTTGNGVGPIIKGENLGGWAVAGFFVVSGFLITRSRLRSSAGSYLLNRIARIFPAFVVVLVITAAVFGPLGLLLTQGSLAGYASTSPTPAQFVWGNITLYMHKYGIGGSLATVPYPDVWNGSLWTLWYEFACYILVWLLGSLAIFRRGPWVAIIAWAGTTALYASSDLVARLGLDADFSLLMKLAPFFLGGAVVYFVIEKHGVNAWIGAASVIVSVVLVLGVDRWGGQLAAPFIAYAVLWLSTLVPQPAWIERNDVSYGFYIYAWPVQQLLVVFGFGLSNDPWMFVLYNVVAAVITFGLGWLSWIFVERPVMAAVKGARAPQPVAAPAT